MCVGYKLYREVRDFAPARLTAGELVVALMIADDASDKTRQSWIPNAELCRRARMAPPTLRKHLAGLAARGLEFRVCHGYGSDGRPVFAARGHATDYVVPDFLKAAMDGAPKAVDNSSEGATDGAAISRERRYESGRKALRNTGKGATDVAPLSSIPSVSPQLKTPVVNSPVEGNGLSTGQARSKIEIAALQAAQSRRERGAR